MVIFNLNYLFLLAIINDSDTRIYDLSKPHVCLANNEMFFELYWVYGEQLSGFSYEEFKQSSEVARYVIDNLLN